MTGAGNEAPEVILDRVPCIYYPVQFWKDKSKGNVSALIDFGSKVNAMTPVYAIKLSFKVWRTNVRAQKIDAFLLATYKMVITAFQVLNKLGRAYFFQELFLLTNISIEVILEMPFLILSNANI